MELGEEEEEENNRRNGGIEADGKKGSGSLSQTFSLHSANQVLGLRQRIAEYEEELKCLAELEEEVDRAFTHLVTDNAQFEVQLTRYYESRAVPGVPHHRPQSGWRLKC